MSNSINVDFADKLIGSTVSISLTSEEDSSPISTLSGGHIFDVSCFFDEVKRIRVIFSIIITVTVNQ